mmetsp:Transcript_44805/g.57387  ORF Transcript_44805/g.57387 Transcript_44805/m.57387 type:complete len:307 (-) Transcript_44805:57-977(-)
MLKLNSDLTSCFICKDPYTLEPSSSRRPAACPSCGKLICWACLDNYILEQKDKSKKKNFFCPYCKAKIFHIDKLPSSHKDFLDIIPLYRLLVQEADNPESASNTKKISTEHLEVLVSEAISYQSNLDIEKTNKAVELALKNQKEEEGRLRDEAVQEAVKKQKKANQILREDAIKEALTTLEENEEIVAKPLIVNMRPDNHLETEEFRVRSSIPIITKTQLPRLLPMTEELPQKKVKLTAQVGQLSRLKEGSFAKIIGLETQIDKNGVPVEITKYDEEKEMYLCCFTEGKTKKSGYLKRINLEEEAP